MFQGDKKAGDAVAFWQAAFPDIAVEKADVAGQTLFHLSLAGTNVTLFDSPIEHAFGLTPAMSLVIETTADDVDRLAEYLADGGEVLMPADSYDFADRFAWVTDRFGVNWQLLAQG